VAGLCRRPYGAVAAVLGAGFVWYAWKVLRMADGDREMRPAKLLFAYSLLYLFAIFAVYLADTVAERAFGLPGV
jgi:protoheme IX farnesyltransferase